MPRSGRPENAAAAAWSWTSTRRTPQRSRSTSRSASPHGQTRPGGGTCSCGGVSDLVDLVAHGDRAGLDDVRAQTGAVDHALQDAGIGEALDVVARLAPLDAHGLHAADPEALVQEVVQAHAGGEHLAADLGVRERDAG